MSCKWPVTCFPLHFELLLNKGVREWNWGIYNTATSQLSKSYFLAQVLCIRRPQYDFGQWKALSCFKQWIFDFDVLGKCGMALLASIADLETHR